MDYELNELLPIVKELSEKYTGKASTSVTYEVAQQLMSAILYCIAEVKYANDKLDNKVMNIKRITAKEAYIQGHILVVNKVKGGKEVYNKIIKIFNGYGNRCYNDTVIKGVPEFFKWYDTKFKPQSNVIMMDYPILISLNKRQGIDAIYEYLQYILVEQTFLTKFKTDFVNRNLSRYSFNVREDIFNVSYVILKKVLVNLLIGIAVQKVELAKEDYIKLEMTVKQITGEELSLKLNNKLQFLVNEIYDGDGKMFSYFQNSILDIVTELQNGASNRTLRNVV